MNSADNQVEKNNGTDEYNDACVVNDPFLQSVDDLTEKDIVINKGKARFKFPTSFLVRSLLILVFLGIFVYSVFLLIQRAGEYYEADRLYDSVANIWNDKEFGLTNPFGSVQYASKDNKSSDTKDYQSSQNVEEDKGEQIVQGSIESSELIAIKAKMNALKIQNKDTIGWITIDNTVIDYPIVLGEDNDYYLTHAFDHTYSIAGTLFADYRNTSDFSENYNTVVYGHNLISGKMFSDLDKYFKKSFFEANRYVYIYTEDGIYIYEVFNVVKISVNVNYIKTYFANPNDFIEFAYAMKAQSLYQTDVQFNSSDRLLTLSTCTNAHNAAERYCVQAKLVEIKK